MKTLSASNRLVIGCLLLLIGLPWGCSEFGRILQDHCCAAEKNRLAQAQRAYDEAAGTAGEKKAEFSAAAGNLRAAATTLGTAMTALVNTPGGPNTTAFNTARTNYNAAVTDFGSALGSVKTAFTDKYSKQEAKNAATVALFSCELTCPTNITCCPGAKTTDKLRELALNLAKEKVSDQEGIVGTVAALQTAVAGASRSLQQYNNDSCPFANAAPQCTTSRNLQTDLGRNADAYLTQLRLEQNALDTLIRQVLEKEAQKTEASTALSTCQRDNNCQ